MKFTRSIVVALGIAAISGGVVSAPAAHAVPHYGEVPAQPADPAVPPVVPARPADPSVPPIPDDPDRNVGQFD